MTSVPQHMNMPTALNWFLNYTFNDMYVLWFGSKKQQIMFQVDDHQDSQIVDKIIGLIENNDIFTGWPDANYFFNSNNFKEGDIVETMTLCLGNPLGMSNLATQVVIIQPFDNTIVHSGQIKVKPFKKEKKG